MNGRLSLILPLLLIVLGTGWLLTTLGIAPALDWIWILSLALTGVLFFVIGGFDKLTVVAGPFFLIASLLSVLRQTDRLALNTEVPVLIIVAGVLLLVARSSRIPMPQWFVADMSGSKND